MKRVVLILALVFGSVWGEETIKSNQDKSWFVGLESGVGLYDLGLSMVITPNLRLYGQNPYVGKINYILGIIGGFQKYTYEKVGFRLSFGIKGVLC